MVPPSFLDRYTLFAYNIGFQATDRTLWQLFSPFGTVQKVNIMLDHEKNQCKGYGFVTMTNYQEALNAINCLNGYPYQGRVLQASFGLVCHFFGKMSHQVRSKLGKHPCDRRRISVIVSLKKYAKNKFPC